MSVEIISLPYETEPSSYALKVNSSVLYGQLISGRIAFLSIGSAGEPFIFDSVKSLRGYWKANRTEIIQASKYNVYTKDPASGSLIKTHSPEFLYEVLEDVFITAFEGGSNYWLSFSDKTFEKISISTNGKMKGRSFSEKALAAILFYGEGLRVIDVENGEILCKSLDLDTIKNRYAKLDSILTNSRISLPDGKGNGCEDVLRRAMFNILQENYDANDADVIMQYLCLEDIVYG